MLSDFGPQFVALLADVLTAPSLPASELPRLKADLAPRTLHRQIAARVAGPRALPENPVSRSSLRPRVSRPRANCKGYTVEDVQTFYRAEFRCRAHASVYCGQARRRLAARGGRRVRRLGQRIARARSAGAPGEGPLVPIHRPARRRAVEPLARPARGRAVQPGLHQAGRHGFAAGRLFRLPHHQQYSRAEGLHLFAVQPDRHAPAPGLLGAIRRRDHRRHRPVAQGDFLRDRPAAQGSAVRARS